MIVTIQSLNRKTTHTRARAKRDQKERSVPGTRSTALRRIERLCSSSPKEAPANPCHAPVGAENIYIGKHANGCVLRSVHTHQLGLDDGVVPHRRRT
jgi:hypothetical protein